MINAQLPDKKKIDLNGLTCQVEFEAIYDEFTESPLGNDDHYGELTDYPTEGRFYRVVTARGNNYIDCDSTYWQSKFDLQESMAYFSKLGMSKHNAYLKAIKIEKSALDRLIGWFNNRWYYVGLVCTITTESGIELGESSLWGIESDCQQDYIDEITNELQSDAWHSAINKAQSIKAELANLNE